MKKEKAKFDFGDKIIFYFSRVDGFVVGKVESISIGSRFIYGTHIKGDVAYVSEKECSLYDGKNKISKMYDEVNVLKAKISSLQNEMINEVGR